MLNNFLNTITTLKAFNFKDSQEKAITNNTEVLSDLQAEQFAQGKDKNDKEILLEGSGYSFFTVTQKRLFGRGLGAVVDHVTLFHSGALYKEIFVSVTKGKVTFSSRVPYWGELMARTGDVTGLNLENRQNFANGYLLPFVGSELKAKTGLIIKSNVGVKL